MALHESDAPTTLPPILVTGITGFIGSHVAANLLARGYAVRGSVRSPDRVDALRAALERQGFSTERLTTVTLDLMSDAGFDAAFQGIHYAIHVASPVPTRPPRHPDELVTPAREGTLRVLRAATRHGLRRVVATSSISAIHAGHPRDGSHVFDENDFSRLDADLTAYDRSKTVAELAAWEFMRSNAAESALELTTINPGFVLGPILDVDPGVTNEVILKLVRREVPGLPDLNFGIIDVRDVAELHVRAVFTPGAGGQRICCALPNMHLSVIATMLVEAGYRVPRWRLPNWLVRVTAKLDPKVALIVPDLGRRVDFDATRAKTMLGWQPRDPKSTVLDAVRSFEAAGLIDRLRRG